LASPKSTTGYVIFLCGNPVVWKSRRQCTTALSSMEAEYVALSSAVSELLWIKHLLCELGYQFDEPLKVFEDNVAAIARAENIGGQTRAKHISLRHHFIQDKIEMKEIQLIQVGSIDNIADGFTKPLPTSPFRKFRDQLNLRHVQLGGRVENSDSDQDQDVGLLCHSDISQHYMSP
jgi:hypothetical protein